MSSDLILPPRRVPARQGRQEEAAVRQAQLPAKRAAARIQAAAIAAHAGLISTETLTAIEAAAVKRQGATMDERARAIVDTYAGLVTTELARLSLKE